MTTKSDIDAAMLETFPNDNFVKVWWTTKLPGLGKQTPNEAFERNPDDLLRYVEGYNSKGDSEE